MSADTTARLFDLIVRALYEGRGSSSARPLHWAILRAASLSNNPRRSVKTIATYLGVDAAEVQIMLTELIERRWIVASGTLAEGGEVRLTELGGSFMANDPCLALAKALERLDRPTIAELSDILEVVFDEVCGVQTESGAGIRRKFLS